MNRLGQLDGIRGCAILAVLIWHYFVCQINVAPSSFLMTMKFWLGFAWSGVDLFFVLSGFLITGILLDNANATNYFRIFYVRRACRILPLYVFMVVAFIAATWVWNSQTNRFPWLLKETIPLWAHATFTQNIFMSFKETWGATYALGPTWSLAVEEQFYLALPLVVYFMPRRVLPVLFVGLIILAPLLRATSTNPVQSYVQAPFRADSLMSGALLAWCVRQPAILRFLVARRRWLYWVLGGALTGAVLVTWRGPQIGGVIDHFVLAAFSASLILLACVDGEGLMARCLRCRALTWLGTLSYGIYLFHQPVVGALHAWCRGSMPRIHGFEDAVITCSALAITLLLAAFSFRFFERRFIEFGHKFRYRAGSNEALVLQPALQPAGK